MIEILQELCALGGISGREHQVADWIQSRLPAGVTVHRDPLGNLLVHKQGRERPSHRLMLCAHMDEVGLIINDIIPEGLLGFSCVGGIDTRVLLARQVLVGERKIPGVIGLKPIHLTKSEERSTLPKVDELYIDIGASDREEARALVRLGDSVTFMPGVRELGKTVLESKAIDDRLGCAVLLEMLREELPFDMDFAFTVQEEVGTRGASAAAYTIDPDFALIVETTTAADIVGVSGSDKVCEQGKGAVVPFMDRGTIYDRGLYELAFKTASAHGIPIQTKTKVAGGNDAGAIHGTRAGIRCIAVSAPCRYLHSPGVTVRREDAQAVLDLTRSLAAEICSREEI